MTLGGKNISSVYKDYSMKGRMRRGEIPKQWTGANPGHQGRARMQLMINYMYVILIIQISKEVFEVFEVKRLLAL